MIYWVVGSMIFAGVLVCLILVAYATERPACQIPVKEYKRSEYD